MNPHGEPDSRRRKVPDAPIPTGQQVLRNMLSFMIAYVIIATPFTMIFDNFWLILVLQLQIVIGTQVLNAELKRMSTTVVLLSQTVSQALKLMLMSLVWPWAVKVFKERAEQYENAYMSGSAAEEPKT